MDTSTSPNIISCLPVMRPTNPGHDLPENVDPPVLDLCVRKRPVSPNYPHDYVSSRYPSRYVEKPPQVNSLRPQSGFSDNSDTSSSENKVLNSNCSTTKLKPSRPFKVYPKNPLSITLIGTTTDIIGKDSAEAYAKFRQKMLSYIKTMHNGTNNNMRRMQSQNPLATDPTYWEKRKKNNEAAKRSRDARKAKEDEIAMRCTFLEQENIQLKFRLAAIESEKERLQNIVYHCK